MENKEIEPLQSNEVVRHRKKSTSDKSKASKKSDHKHQYYDVLIHGALSLGGKPSDTYCLGKKCRVCGKVEVTKYLITKKLEDKTYLVLDNNEILETYKNLEIVEKS